MKKFLITIAFLSLTAPIVYAATPSPVATDSAAAPTLKAARIDDLKERLATKVAELRTSQKKAITGTIKSVSVSSFTVETVTNEVKIELTDDIKVVQLLKDKRTVLTTDDLEKNDSVVVFGDYDASLDLLKAKVIFIQPVLPERVSGTISKVDKEEYTITVTSFTGKEFVIDIEKYTAILSYTKPDSIVKSGFSKLVAGDIVHLTGSLQPKNPNRLSGLRILSIGTLQPPTPTTQETPTASPSATTKSTPKVTPKPTNRTSPSPTPAG